MEKRFVKAFQRFSLVLIALTLNCFAEQKKLPIVLVHGLVSDPYEMKPTEQYIKKHLGKDVYIKNVKLGSGYITSFFNMFDQIEWLRQEVQSDPKLKDGFNMIGHSQGGLVARGYIQYHNTPKVHNFISWGTPNQGIMGMPGNMDVKYVWLNIIEQYAYRFLYSDMFQKYVSVGGYWHDSVHYNTYLKKCQFLPILNNHKPHDLAEQFKTNMCSLNKLVLVASDREDIIEPAISCHFGYYKKGSYTITQTMFETEDYQEDRLGLKTLYEKGKLHLLTAHCAHDQYQEDEDNFIKNTLPYLKPADEQEKEESCDDEVEEIRADDYLSTPAATAIA